MIKISGKDITPFYDTTKPEGDKAHSADYSKAKKVLGWEPKVNLEEGLNCQYDWLRPRFKECIILYESYRKSQQCLRFMALG